MENREPILRSDIGNKTFNLNLSNLTTERKVRNRKDSAPTLLENPNINKKRKKTEKTPLTQDGKELKDTQEYEKSNFRRHYARDRAG